MKRPILILSAGIVVIALLLLVNEKWLKETSAPKSAETQEEEEAVQQDSTADQKAKAKSASKPPVYDLSNKTHWYDPETTIGLYGSRILAKEIEPFKPTSEEFQIIAQYEVARRKLKESLSEDEYYSVEGRKRLIDGILELNKQLREDLGEERTQFYAEVGDPYTGYYNTWEVLKVNGISEERVAEFRELADEFNRQMHGRPLYRAERRIAYYSPADWYFSYDEHNQIAKTFRERIEKEFGRQVLDDTLSLSPDTFFMDELGGMTMMMTIDLLHDPSQQERLKDLYDYHVDFSEPADEVEKEIEESKRLGKLEIKLIEAWGEKYGDSSSREPPIGWIP